MKKILIIGKTSYVGTSLKEYYAKHYPHDEIAQISSRDNQWEKYDFSQYDAIFNVSGLCHADSKHGTYDMYMDVNGALPVRMARKAKEEGAKLFIHMSSMIVYGKMSYIGVEKEITTATKPEPVNVYGESKLFAEKGLMELEDEIFGVAIIRAPLIYGENARDNFPRLVKYAKIMPIFPNIKNSQSMIYIDNFCELIHLIVENGERGIFCPQDKEYICTSQLVKDIASASGRKLILTKIFNPFIYFLSKRMYFFDKVFGNITYSKEVSKYFDDKYLVVNYKTAIENIVKM